MKVLDVLEGCQSEPREMPKENAPAVGKLSLKLESRQQQKKLSEIVILAVCFQLNQLKKQVKSLKAHCKENNFTHVYPQFTYMIFIIHSQIKKKCFCKLL